MARHRFTLGTIEAKAGHIHSALTALEHAARLGYDNVEQLAAEATLETLPVEPRLTDGGPVGLYFMTKGYVGSSKVEKVAWYFEPGGRVHSYVRLGFSPEELAADGSTDGRVRMDAGQMEIAWDDGQTRRARLEAKPDGSFWWDMGLFTRVAPLTRSAAIGRWEFVTEIGVSHHENIQGGGNRRTRIIRLDLAEDGTYVHTGSLFVTVDNNPDVDSQGRQETRGRWTTGTYALTLLPDGGSSSRALAFTRDDSDTPEPSDWLFHNGLLYRRLRP